MRVDHLIALVSVALAAATLLNLVLAFQHHSKRTATVKLGDRRPPKPTKDQAETARPSALLARYQGLNGTIEVFDEELAVRLISAIGRPALGSNRGMALRSGRTVRSPSVAPESWGTVLSMEMLRKERMSTATPRAKDTVYDIASDLAHIGRMPVPQEQLAEALRNLRVIGMESVLSSTGSRTESAVEPEEDQIRESS
ncbi:hypothetical protein AB0B11_08400 [Micromonospora tulbaghiae]|uniref:hypothetical protein n=1 Tax=Micromonospora tulbaghiae TaxID=479978 RepID=UPI0033C0047D